MLLDLVTVKLTSSSLGEMGTGQFPSFPPPTTCFASHEGAVIGRCCSLMPRKWERGNDYAL